MERITSCFNIRLPYDSLCSLVALQFHRTWPTVTLTHHQKLRNLLSIHYNAHLRRHSYLLSVQSLATGAGYLLQANVRLVPIIRLTRPT